MAIKLLLVIDNEEFGGGERGFLQLAKGLAGDFDIVMASRSGGRVENEAKEIGVEWIPIDMTKRFSLSPIRCLIRAIRSKRIDILHSQGARADFFARIAGKIAGVPHIISTIQMPVEGFDVEPLLRKAYRFADYLSERYVDRFIAVSGRVRKTLLNRCGMSSERVVLIYNGIELDEYCPGKAMDIRSQYGIAPDAPLVGAVGRMVWQKGFEYLIDAVPEIVRIVPEARFLMVGEGSLRPALEKMSKRLGASDKIIFTGYRSDIQRVLASLDLLVFPSLVEGFPMIILEGMAMAKPIVATEIDGVTEQISHEKEGLLVAPRDSKALADAVLKVLQDANLAQLLGKAACARVEREFSIGNMISRTKEVYMSVYLCGN